MSPNAYIYRTNQSATLNTENQNDLFLIVEIKTTDDFTAEMSVYTKRITFYLKSFNLLLPLLYNSASIRPILPTNSPPSFSIHSQFSP